MKISIDLDDLNTTTNARKIYDALTDTVAQNVYCVRAQRTEILKLEKSDLDRSVSIESRKEEINHLQKRNEKLVKTLIDLECFFEFSGH